MSRSLPSSRVARLLAPLAATSCLPFPGFTLPPTQYIRLSSRVQYFQQEAEGQLSHWVKWFWMIESNTMEVGQQKIIPDGYPEIIFHFGDPYEIDISGHWVRQAPFLLAGQIRSFFHLRNTGASRMFAIKLQPWSIHALFGVDAALILDQVVPFPSVPGIWDEVKSLAISNRSFEEKCQGIRELIESQRFDSPMIVHRALERILLSNGMLTVQELVQELEITERTLERHFKIHVGMSPKRYCRIIRHAFIFKVINEKPDNWAQVAYKAGYYDQTHFIKNFQEFTGEDPSKYGFDEQNFANFFLK